MSDRNIRVTVQRDELIVAIERKANQCKKDWQKSVDAFEKKFLVWQKAQVKALRERADGLEAMTFEQYEKDPWISNRRGNAADQKVPEQPRQPHEPQGYAHILRLLRMSKKPTISLTEDQFRAYMDGCAIR